jgi:hypothetical protein
MLAGRTYSPRSVHYQLLFGLKKINKLLVVTFIISFSIGCGSGLDIIKYQHSSKPSTLGENYADIFHNHFNL